MAIFRKKRVFISHSKDMGNDYVRAVRNAVQKIIGYKSYDMYDKEVQDAIGHPTLDKEGRPNDPHWLQKGINRFILHSKLMVLVLDKTYKGGTKEEYEKVAKYGNRVKTFVFLKEYADRDDKGQPIEPTPSSPRYKDFMEQKENVLPFLRSAARYIRYEDADGLEKAVEEELRHWKEKRSRARLTCFIAASILFLLLLGYSMQRYLQGMKLDNVALVSQYNKALDTVEDLIRRNTATSLDAAKDSLHAINERFPADIVKDEEILSLRHKVDSLKRIKDTPNQGKGEGRRGGFKPIPAPITLNDNEFSVAAPLASYANNIGAGICSVLPSLKYTDGGKNRWTITVSEDPDIKEMPGTYASDPLIVTITFTVKIKDNNGKEEFSPVSFKHSDQGWNRDQAIAETRKSAIPRIVSIVKKALQ